MLIYVSLVTIIVILGILLKEKNKKGYCFTICALLLLLIGCRHISMGIVDTEFIYIPTYEKISTIAFGDILSYYTKDILFHYMTKIFIMIHNNSQLWLGIIALPLIVGIYKILYKYSKNAPLSFLVFLALNFYGMSFTILRHSIALGILLFSYKYLKERKFYKFLILVLLASCFHQTALIFIIAYPLYTIKFNAKQILIIAIALLLSVTVGNTILGTVLNVLNQDRYQSYSDSQTTLSLTNFYVNMFFLLICAFYYRLVYRKREKDIDGLLNLSTISCCLLTFTPILGEIYRIAMFFGIFNTLLIPNVFALPVDEKNKKFKLIIYFLLYGMLILYFLIFALNNASIVPYRFFWE